VPLSGETPIDPRLIVPPSGRSGEAPGRSVLDLLAEIERQLAFGRGYHNDNYRLPPLSADDALELGLPAGVAIKVRVRRATPVVVQRVWDDEAALLRELKDTLLVPLAVRPASTALSVHTYLEGEPLAASCPPGTEVAGGHVRQIAGIFASMLRVDSARLPQLPEGWPADGKSDEFFRARVEFAQRELADANEERFGALFRALGVRPAAMAEFGANVTELTPRRFGLLHTDLHRSNLIVGVDGRIRVIDWEHAMFGDPLYDLATHLCRMEYPAHQHRQVREEWLGAVAAVSEDYVDGWRVDLPAYIAYERAQSVYPDIIRAARSLGALPEEAVLHHAAAWIGRTLRRAGDHIALRRTPDEEEIRSHLLRWHREFGPRPSRG
jgi:aminoglycoside phosphotransferase (APT) family kinase protein